MGLLFKEIQHVACANYMYMYMYYTWAQPQKTRYISIHCVTLSSLMFLVHMYQGYSRLSKNSTKKFQCSFVLAISVWTSCKVT